MEPRKSDEEVVNAIKEWVTQDREECEAVRDYLRRFAGGEDA